MHPNYKNCIFLSSLLEEDFKVFYKNFTLLLKENNICYSLLPNTKDIWCRDFMPLFVGPNQLITYKYNPDYLKDHSHLRTDFSEVNKTMKLEEKFKIINTDIVLDGGNIVKSKNTIILTDKIFSENPNFSKEKLLIKIEQNFKIKKIVIIPWDKEFDKDDYFGHADGMVRFINENRVLVNGFINDYKTDFKIKFFNTLKENNLEYEILDTKEWGYINFLQFKKTIILPLFGIDEDKKAIDKIKSLYPSYTILTINAIDIKEKGGVLNCITWTLD